MEPTFDPLYYVFNAKHGKFTRMRALSAAYEAGIVTKIDVIIDLYDAILNNTRPPAPCYCR